MNSTISAQALIPVSFRNTTLSLIEHNGEPYAAMRPIVEGMGLDWASQSVKLNSNNARWGVAMIATPSAGGAQRSICMPLRKLPGWLASIHPNKVRPELRETIIAFQNECDDALWAYWNSTRLQAPTSVALPGQKLTAEHARALQEAVAARADTAGPDKRSGAYARLWGAIKSHFRIPTYRELDDSQFSAALCLIERLPIDTPALPPPEDPTLTIDDLARLALTNRRWCLSFGPEGQPRLTAIEDGAIVAHPSKIAALVGDPASNIRREHLPEIITAAANRLARVKQGNV